MASFHLPKYTFNLIEYVTKYCTVTVFDYYVFALMQLNGRSIFLSTECDLSG